MSFKTRSRASIVGSRFILLALFCAVAGQLFRSGISLRQWAWAQTDPIHFYADMNNGVHWGSQGNEPAGRPRGFLNVYDFVAANAPRTASDSPDYGLDYAPLRLLLITHWQDWAARHDPEMMKTAFDSADNLRKLAWHPPFSFYAPLLRFNEAMEIAGAAALFLLTRHWVLRGDRRWGSASPAGVWGAVRRPFRGCGAGAVAAALFWFNPAVILSTHGWPTWDEWIVPFFVWTLWLCCVDWWFTAGVVLAIGAMLKGQQFFVAPIFVLWPLLVGRPLSALRWVSGLAIGVAVIASPWLVTYVPGGVTADATANDRRFDWAAVLFIVATILLVSAPILWKQLTRLTPLPSKERRISPTATSGVLWLAPLYAPLAILILAGALLLCAVWFHGTFNWMYIGWGYGTRHYPNMVTGLSDNLAGLLVNRFGWNNLTDVAFTVENHAVTIRTLLIMIYGCALSVCIVGMAIQYRRNDPKFLVAVTGAWLMFFAFLPQIHERYLLYAAGVGCSLAGVSAGFLLMDLFFSALTFMMTIHVMFNLAAGDHQLRYFAAQISPTFSRSLFRVIRNTYPDAAWALLLCAAIFLYHSVAPSLPVRRRGAS